jgi:hypothetical protein
MTVELSSRIFSSMTELFSKLLSSIIFSLTIVELYLIIFSSITVLSKNVSSILLSSNYFF